MTYSGAEQSGTSYTIKTLHKCIYVYLYLTCFLSVIFVVNALWNRLNRLIVTCYSITLLTSLDSI